MQKVDRLPTNLKRLIIESSQDVRRTRGGLLCLLTVVHLWLVIFQLRCINGPLCLRIILWGTSTYMTTFTKHYQFYHNLYI
jgi:cobalamin biosynthesis protein CobD/CbiB